MQEKDLIKEFHKLSARHVLALEADMSQQEIDKIVRYADKERKAGNELVGEMRKRYEQLIRTKRYRKLLGLYGKTESKEKRRKYAKQLNEMQKEYNVTWDYCRKTMIPIGKKYGLKAVTALTKAEDIWGALEKCLYSNGRTIHFSKRNELPSIRAKQVNTGIIINVKDNNLVYKFNDLVFSGKITDRFKQDEINAIIEYLSQPEIKDKEAVETLLETGECISTYRPCYVTLVPKIIRGRYRIYVHITVEGLPKPKRDRNGNLKHSHGRGMIGCDIGTQTIAYTSKTEVGLKNLAERGQSIRKSERQERLLYRAMDRSRRATNPNNYNEDGTVKKGVRTWVYSNHYKKMQERHKELCRKNAINRQLAINEDINHIRSLGDFFVTEPKNFKSLQARAKETTKNSKGKYNRKKRYGKSIGNRCPGYFQKRVKQKFKQTNGVYVEVPSMYRASQYDHTVDGYIQKKLNDRMYNLQNGQEVQRDWYSSYLLYCYDLKSKDIDKIKCREEFGYFYEKELNLIDYIKKNKIRVMNSGIKIA